MHSHHHHHHHGHGHGQCRGGRPWGRHHSRDDQTADEAATQDATAEGPAAATRIFVCAAKSCRHGGGAELAEALRQRIEETGADIDVRACGCLDDCDNGPVAVAHGGAAARAARPPKGKMAQWLHRPLARFPRASADQAQAIIDQLTTDKTR